MPKVLLDQSETFTATGDTRTYTWGIADTTKPVRITMAYADAPGSTTGNPQVNNLDLKVVVGGQTYLGNHFTNNFSTTGGATDTANNYEAVFLPAGTSGDITITVTAANIAGDGTGSGSASQDFALVCSDCSQAPLVHDAQRADRCELCAGTEFDATLDIGVIKGFSDPVRSQRERQSVRHDRGAQSDHGDSARHPDFSLTSDASVTPGEYTMTLTGTSGSITKSVDFDADIFDRGRGRADARFAGQWRELDAAAAGVHVGAGGAGVVVPRSSSRPIRRSRTSWSRRPSTARRSSRTSALGTDTLYYVARHRDEHVRLEHRARSIRSAPRRRRASAARARRRR